MLKVCHKADNIATADDSVYYYRIREGAATSAYTMSRSRNELATLEEIINYLGDKPRDYYHLAYVSTLMQSYLSRYYYALQHDEISAEAQEEYYRRFCNIVAFSENDLLLSKNYPEIMIYIKYQHIIPVEKERGKKLFLEGVESWTNFFLDHSAKLEKWHYSGYAAALLRSYVINIRENRAMTKGINNCKIFYKEQLSRLPVRDRRKIIRLLPGVALTKMLHRIL